MRCRSGTLPSVPLRKLRSSTETSHCPPWRVNPSLISSTGTTSLGCTHPDTRTLEFVVSTFSDSIKCMGNPVLPYITDALLVVCNIFAARGWCKVYNYDLGRLHLDVLPSALTCRSADRHLGSSLSGEIKRVSPLPVHCSYAILRPCRIFVRDNTGRYFPSIP